MGRNKKLRNKKKNGPRKLSQPKTKIKKVLSHGEYVYWVAHGCNYLNSPYDRGLWNPLFEGLYDGREYTKEVVSSFIEKTFVEPNNTLTREGLPLVAWILLPKSRVCSIYNQILNKVDEDNPCEKARMPHNGKVWEFFENEKGSLIEQAKKYTQ